jgi:hypothetical protein
MKTFRDLLSIGDSTEFKFGIIFSTGGYVAFAGGKRPYIALEKTKEMGRTFRFETIQQLKKILSNFTDEELDSYLFISDLLGRLFRATIYSNAVESGSENYSPYITVDEKFMLSPPVFHTD